MSGGFVPALVHTEDKLTGWINILASQNMTAKRTGITIDHTRVAANADGDRIVANGTILSEDEATGKFYPYRPGTEADVADCILFNGGVNARHGDVITGAMIGGSVLKARIPNYDAAADADLTHIIFQ